MADGFTDDDGQETGGSLRTKLEAALSELKSMRDENGAMKAEKIIRDKGYKLLTPEDLKGVDPKELESEAEKRFAAKKEAQRLLAKDLLGRRHGVEGDELDRLVDEYMGESDGPADIDRFRESVSVGGSPAPRVNPDKLDPFEKIQHALETSGKRKRR